MTDRTPLAGGIESVRATFEPSKMSSGQLTSVVADGQVNRGDYSARPTGCRRRRRSGRILVLSRRCKKEQSRETSSVTHQVEPARESSPHFNEMLSFSMLIDQHDFHGLLHSAELIETRLRSRLAPLGILPRQARIIEAMARLGPVSQVDLATEFGVTSASMSTMTDRLATAGYITRRVDPDSRRQNIIELTSEGRALLAGIDKAWTSVDDAIREVLGEGSAPFFYLARHLRDGLGGIIPGASRDRTG